MTVVDEKKEVKYLLCGAYYKLYDRCSKLKSDEITLIKWCDLNLDTCTPYESLIG